MMKHLCLFTAFIISCFYLHAQTKKLDSLNNLISKATSDTQRINLLVEKINSLESSNLDSAISVAAKTIEDAQRINYKKGEARTRISVAFAYSYKGDFVSAQTNLDISKSILTAINDTSNFGRLYNGYGIMYAMQNKYDTSIIFYKKALVYAEKQNDLSRMSSTYQNMAIAYQQQSNFPEALKYYQKALTISEKTKDEEDAAYLYLNIAITYMSIDYSKRAEESFLKAVDLSKKLQLKNVEAYAYANLASLYGDSNAYEKEYDVAMKAAVIAKDIGDLGIEASSLSRAAVALAFKNKFGEAEKLSAQALSIAIKSAQPLNIYQTNSDAGLVFKLQQKYKEAIPYFEKAFHELTDADLYDAQVATSYKNASECYEKTGNYNKALETYKKSVDIQDSLTSKQNIRKSTELTLNYEFAQKQQAAKADQQKKDEVSKTKQTALIIGLVLTIFLAAVAFNGFRNKRKSNFLLQQQKEEVQDTLKELKLAQAQLIQAEKMASLGELTAGIAHEIQNPLNFVNNFSDINTELITELQEERSKTVNEIDNNNVNEIIGSIKDNEQKINYHGKRADAIVKNMLQHSRANSGQKELININTLCDEYFRLSYHGMRAKDKTFNAHMKTDFDESIEKINVVQQDIGRVLLNLFNNAFYATSEKLKIENAKQNPDYKPTVSISTKHAGINSPLRVGGIEIIISDNGNGIPQNILDKIFQPFFTTKPTGQGTGLGLSLSYDIITKEHNGTIKAESKPGEGTTFTIHLP